MPVTNWNTTTIDGDPYLVVDLAKLRVPLNWDPSSNVFLAVAAPNGIDGDALFSYPGLVKGDDGAAPTIDEDVNLTVLDYDDSTPDSASWTLISPGVYQYTTTSRRGPTGATGTPSILGASDLAGTPAAGKMIVVNGAANGAVFQTQKVGDWFIPASIYDTASGNPTFTLCTVPMGPFDFDWRPTVEGQTIVTAAGGTDVVTDLVARIGSASGNICGQCFGLTSTERLVLSSGPPAGSTDSYDRISAGQTTTIYLRAERRTGSNTFTTSGSTTKFRVKADPIP
jgi:hypothetical protein